MNKSNPGNFFTDKLSIRTIDTYRIIYALIAIISFIITEIGRKLYRPFIYEKSIDDFGLADSIGNLGGIVVQIFFMLAILNSPKKKTFNLIGFVVVGYIIYEVAQPYLPKGVFDWKDVYGTFIGGLISLSILLIIHNSVKNKIIFMIKD